MQQLSCHPAGLADSPALGEKLERVEGEDQVVLGAVAVDQLADLLVRRTGLEPSLNGQPEQCDAGRGRARVDYPHPLSADLLSRVGSALPGAGELARDV